MPQHPTRLFRKSFFIRILAPNGDADGLRVVEKSNWPCVGVVFNRTNYRKVTARLELDKNGVYVFVGQPE